MPRNLLAILVPPLAVCRYGCAGCCAAPIGVFWIAGIVGIVYGFFGGPAGLDHISWATTLLGCGLWIIAILWAYTVLRGVADDQGDPKCQQKRSNICRIVSANDQSGDPLDEVKKFSN